MKTPLILEIKGNSLDDGPGIRTVVFFKGCPLDCLWCHNPESKRPYRELSFDGALCTGCGACAKACPEGAVSLKKKERIHRKKCTRCFECVPPCPSGAMEITGKEMTTKEIRDIAVKDKIFYDNSGGGVTLSGGEPAMAPEFTGTLCRILKKEKIHVLMETCGLFDRKAFMEHIYPFLDYIYFDIKIMDGAAHKKQCGVSNESIIENFLFLHEKYRQGGTPILPRTPLVPAITDTEENLKAIAAFYTQHSVKKARLLSYNPLWHGKNSKLGYEEISNKKKLSQFMPGEEISRCRNIFENEGIDLGETKQ